MGCGHSTVLPHMNTRARCSPKAWQGHPGSAEISGMATLGLLGMQKSHALCVSCDRQYKPG